MPSRARWAGPVLALSAALLTALGLESAFRLRAHLQNRGLLGAAVDAAPLPPRGKEATLGQMIRRSRNPRIVYELKPGLDVIFVRGRVTTGPSGFRVTPGGGAGEARRIVGLGDSYMFGHGVNDEQTYLASLQAQLLAGGAAWQVVNTAVPGYNTVMEVETLKEKALQPAPRIVIVEVVGNDLDLPNFIAAPQPVWAGDRSFLADFVRHRLALLRRGGEVADGFGLRPAPQTYDTGVLHYEGDPSRVPPEYAGMVGWPAYERAMRELAGLRDRRGFAVVVLSQSPSFDWFDHHGRRLARELGFHFLDVGRVIRRYLAANRYDHILQSPLAVSRTDAHPSAQGHQLAAGELSRFLAQRGLLQ